jgi:hypothetical protein
MANAGPGVRSWPWAGADRLNGSASDAVASRAGLWLVLAVAFAIRLWVLATHTYVVQPDETFQYLEPAHRLLFGSGVITWEFLDGIRSWFLPGILAGVMWVTSLVSPEPTAYVMVARLLCIVASLSIPFVGHQLAARRFGPAPALLVGLLCALSYDAVYFADTIITEPLATDAALLAIWCGDGAPVHRRDRRRPLVAGFLFGLAATLRWQYAPVLALTAAAQYVRQPRSLAWVVTGGMSVVVPVLGGLDALTWGLPFQSVWLNYVLNEGHGFSGAMGTETWYFYLAYYSVAAGVLIGPLALCVLIGLVRLPIVAIVTLATIGLHMLVPHKELRFVFLATACIPMLIGVGAATLLGRVRRLRSSLMSLRATAAIGVLIAATTALLTYTNATPADAWHRYRSISQATAMAREVPGVCGFGVRDAGVYVTGGYTYWHRDVPIYYELWDASQHIKGSNVWLRLDSVLDGRSVPQFPDLSFPAHASRFNVMISEESGGLPGFDKQKCFGAGSIDDRIFCVYTRPGGCE